MKKLMFAAAVAASSMAFAATPAAQVYDVTFNIKTTKAASAKNVNHKANPIAVADGDVADVLYYRTQTSVTWKGLIWGCNCEAIDGVWETVDPCFIDKDGQEFYGEGETVKGCIVWDVKGKAPVYMGEGVNVSDIDVSSNPGWGWDFLNLINKDAKGVECVFDIIGAANMCEEDDVETFDFRGAGFGNAQFSLIDGEVLCNSYLKKMSGDFAGWMSAPTIDMVTQQAAGCSFCGSAAEKKDCDFVYGWEWCDFGSACGCDMDVNTGDERTAAYGTWTIQYNSSLSKKLSNATSIRGAYNFNKLPEVAKAIELAEKQILGIRARCADFEDALNVAKQGVIDAQAEIERVKTANLQATLDEANAAQREAQAAYNASNLVVYGNHPRFGRQTNGSYDLYVDASNAWANAVAATDKAWSFWYKNGSQDPAQVQGSGAQAMLDKLAEFGRDFTILVDRKTDGPVADRYDHRPVYNGTRYASVNEAKDALNEIIANVETTATARDAAKETYESDLANLNDAQEALNEANAAQSAAQADYNDRVALQAAADRQLGNAEAAVAAAELALKACKDAE